jgi:hypothetical protein
MKKSTKVAGALIAFAALVSAATPAYAFTPTISEVRSLNGPDSSDSWYSLSLTSDATTAVISADSGVFIVDVATNSGTAVAGVEGGASTILDSNEAFLYAADDSGYPSYTTSVKKIDMATKSVVATWTDPAYTLVGPYMFMSPDGASIYLVSDTGSYPNYGIGVAKVNVATGAITQYGATNSGVYLGQPAYDSTSGLIYVPYVDSATRLVSGFAVFDTANNDFTDLSWTGSGTLEACDSQAGVVACLVDDTVPYLAKINSSGAATSTLAVDAEVSSVETLTLTPDASQVFVYGDNGGFGNVELIDMASMTSVTVFNTSLDYPNVVTLAKNAGQIWFTADYVADYNGGYQVIQYADPAAPVDPAAPALANTGTNPATFGIYVALSVLLLTAGAITLTAVRRRHAQP